MISWCSGLEEVYFIFGFLLSHRYSVCSTEGLQKLAFLVSEKFPSEFSVEFGSKLSSFQQTFFNRNVADDSERQSQGIMPYLTFIVTTDQRLSAA